MFLLPRSEGCEPEPRRQTRSRRFRVCVVCGGRSREGQQHTCPVLLPTAFGELYKEDNSREPRSPRILQTRPVCQAGVPHADWAWRAGSAGAVDALVRCAYVQKWAANSRARLSMTRSGAQCLGCTGTTPLRKGTISCPSCVSFGSGANVYHTWKLCFNQLCEWLARLCVSTGTQGKRGFPSRGGCCPSIPATRDT